LEAYALFFLRLRKQKKQSVSHLTHRKPIIVTLQLSDYRYCQIWLIATSSAAFTTTALQLTHSNLWSVSFNSYRSSWGKRRGRSITPRWYRHLQFRHNRLVPITLEPTNYTPHPLYIEVLKSASAASTVGYVWRHKYWHLIAIAIARSLDNNKWKKSNSAGKFQSTLAYKNDTSVYNVRYPHNCSQPL